MNSAFDQSRRVPTTAELASLEGFLGNLREALRHFLNLDWCEIYIGDERIGPARQEQEIDHDSLISLPLVTDDGTIGTVLGYRTPAILSDREERTLPPKLRLVAERIQLMREGQFPEPENRDELSPEERARLERNQVEALLRAQKAVASQEDTDATLEAIVIELERILKLTTAHVYIVDSQAETLVNRVSRIYGASFEEHFSELPLRKGLIGAAVEAGQSTLFPAAHLDPRSYYPPDVEPMIRLLGESIMVGPLLSNGTVTGVLFVNRLGHRSFSDTDFRLFQLFVGQVESVFDKAIRLEAERRSRQSAESLARLAVRLAMVETDSDLLLAVGETAVELTGATCVLVRVVDASGKSWLEACNEGGAVFNVARSGIQEQDVHFDGQPLEPYQVIHQYDSLPSVFREYLGEDDFRDAVAVPIVGSAGHCGFIWYASRNRAVRQTLSSQHCESLSGMTAVTLDRIRVRNLASQLEGTIDVLSRSSRIALEARDDLQAVRDLVTLLSELFDARVISGWLNEPRMTAGKTDYLKLVHQIGDSDFHSIQATEHLARSLQSRRSEWNAQMLVVPDLHGWGLPASASKQCQALDINAAVAFCLADAQQTYGMVRVDLGSRFEIPSERQLRLAMAVVDQFSVELGAIRMRGQWMELYRSSVEALAATVDAKDPYTHQHSRNVSFYSKLLAMRIGLSEVETQQIELAGILHDIGKIGIADRILTKTEPLDPQERMEMMAHPVRGAQILANDSGLTALVPIIRHHHERHDGLGYPDGLSGDSIPLGAAIVSVADAVDTMLNDRSYSERLTVNEVRSELRSGIGTQFRPEVASEMLAVLEDSPELLRIRKQGDVGTELPAGARDHLPVAEVAQVRIISRMAQELRALTDLPTFVEGARRIVAEELGYKLVEIVLDEQRPNSLSVGGQELTSAGPVCEHICRIAIQRNQAVNVPDLGILSDSHEYQGSAISVPLRVEGDAIGAMAVVVERQGAFSIVDEALLTVAANQLAAGLSVAQLHDRVKWTARHDALTQALNHGAFYDELANAISYHLETRDPVSLILCDVEGLKAVNDRLGHLAGDSVLRLLVRRIREIVRDQDLIARYGGDEFAVITYGTTLAEARDLTSQLLESLQRYPLLGSATETQVTTGIAQVGEDAITPSELVRIADHRLYQARGRRLRMSGISSYEAN